MIPAHHDDGVLVLAQLLQFLDQDSQAGVEGGDLTEVVRQVLTHFVDVGQESGHLALEVVGIDAPKLLARPLDPFAVHVGGAEPVGEGLVLLALVENDWKFWRASWYSSSLAFSIVTPLDILPETY